MLTDKGLIKLLSDIPVITTDAHDDSSSPTTEPTSSSSPNVRFRDIFKYWRKGEFLGQGSSGSVYKGIAE